MRKEKRFDCSKATASKKWTEQPPLLFLSTTPITPHCTSFLPLPIWMTVWYLSQTEKRPALYQYLSFTKNSMMSILILFIIKFILLMWKFLHHKWYQDIKVYTIFYLPPPFVTTLLKRHEYMWLCFVCLM